MPEVFDQFYLNLTLLNYHFKSGTPLNEKYKKMWGIIKTMIPIFNKLYENNDIQLSDIKNENFNDSSEEKTKYPSNNHQQLNTSDDMCSLFDSDDDKKFQPFQQLIQGEKDSDNNSTDDEDEKDEEGDKNVADLTATSLSQLDYVRKLRWAETIDDEDITDDDTTDDEDNEKDSNGNNSDNNSSINDDKKCSGGNDNNHSDSSETTFSDFSDSGLLKSLDDYDGWNPSNFNNYSTLNQAGIYL